VNPDEKERQQDGGRHGDQRRVGPYGAGAAEDGGGQRQQNDVVDENEPGLRADGVEVRKDEQRGEQPERSDRGRRQQVRQGQRGEERERSAGEESGSEIRKRSGELPARSPVDVAERGGGQQQPGAGTRKR